MTEKPKNCIYCSTNLPLIDLDNFYEKKYKDNVFKFYVCHNCGRITSERIRIKRKPAANKAARRPRSNLNHLKSFMGKTVNLYMCDGAVIACVTVLRITNSKVWVRASKHGKPLSFKIRDISSADAVTILDDI